MRMSPFEDRAHAGRLLAAELGRFSDCKDVIVLGLPRGGVPVAFEIARQLNAPMDVLIVRKLGVPGWEELAMGAIASGGVRVLNAPVIRSAGVGEQAIEEAVEDQTKELRRREMAYRGHAGAPEVAGRTVILVDDGIATGSTVRAAIQALRQRHPAHLVLAVPVAAPDSCAMLEPLVDELVVLMQPDDFRAVGQWYADFAQTTDEEVTRLMQSARHLRAGG